MFITAIPNRNSPPALRESYRENGKVKSRTTCPDSRKPPVLDMALKGNASATP